jgi:hypothetical protein
MIGILAESSKGVIADVSRESISRKQKFCALR